jgi:hypothetical protein
MLVIQCVQFAGNISRRLIYALSRISGNVQLIVLLIYCFARANQDKWSSRRRCAAEKYIIKLKHLLGSHKTRVKTHDASWATDITLQLYDKLESIYHCASIACLVNLICSKNAEGNGYKLLSYIFYKLQLYTN